MLICDFSYGAVYESNEKEDILIEGIRVHSYVFFILTVLWAQFQYAWVK